MLEKPEIVQSAEQTVACIDVVVPRERIREVMGPAIAEVYGALGAQGVQPAGPWLTHHKKAPDETFDFQVCVPVSKEVAPAGRVRSGRLPAAKVARAVYVGPYEGLGAAWGELRAWVAKSGHTCARSLWECYAVGPDSQPDPNAYRTELNQPLL
jgi:effector-binding domain-containing protein